MTDPERDPVAFVQRAMAALPPDPANAGEKHVRALLEIEAGLHEVVERANQALDEAWSEVEDYLDRIPSVHGSQVVVRTSTTVTKQDPPAEEAQQR